MRPTIVKNNDDCRMSLGVSGGRRIMSAVLQLIAFFIDFSINLETVIHHPRINVHGDENILFDTAMDLGISEKLSQMSDKVTDYPRNFS
jgi:gamma-glutamyltranspeptidase/glutathione hydrolase